MNETIGQFRTAAFGFHRQDVLDYLTKTAKEQQEAAAALQRQLEEEQTARQGLEETHAALEAELAQARIDLEERDGLSRALEEKTAALEAAEETITSLSSQIGSLEPEAESWKRIKDTAGDIEVGAHERAQILMQDAQARKAEIQAEGVRYILDIQNRCDRLQEDLRHSVQNAQAELDTVRDAFAKAEMDLEGYQKALSDLIAAVEK